MAAQRYSRILQSARYYAAIDNYIKYITDASKRGSKVGTGTARPPSKVLYIQPFALELGADTFVKVSCSATAWNLYKTNFTGYAKETLGGTENSVKPEGFRAARVIIVTGRTGTGSVKTSAVTGMKYKSYGGKSTSIPFGEKTETEDMTAAFNAIKTALGDLGAGSLVTLQPEKF